MKFWATSAVVPLCVTEPATSHVRKVLAADGTMVVWWATRTECLSAFARRRREGGLSDAEEEQVQRVLGTLAAVWTEVSASERLRDTAERLLRIHPLRAADAFQLAAALVWCGDRPRESSFVAFDDRLRQAALREGFELAPR